MGYIQYLFKAKQSWHLFVIKKYYVAVVTMVTDVVVIVIVPNVQLINTSVWVAYDNNSYITNACRKLTLFPTSKCDEYFSCTYMQYSRS